MDTVFSEQLLTTIKRGMAAAFKRSTALCVNEMNRIFDSYTRRSEARRLAGGGVGHDQSGHVARQADFSSPHSGFVWDEASGYYYDAYSGFYYDGNAGLYYDGNSSSFLPIQNSEVLNGSSVSNGLDDEVGGAEFGNGVGKMTDKLESVGNGEGAKAVIEVEEKELEEDIDVVDVVSEIRVSPEKVLDSVGNEDVEIDENCDEPKLLDVEKAKEIVEEEKSVLITRDKSVQVCFEEHVEVEIPPHQHLEFFLNSSGQTLAPIELFDSMTESKENDEKKDGGFIIDSKDGIESKEKDDEDKMVVKEGLGDEGKLLRTVFIGNYSEVSNSVMGEGCILGSNVSIDGCYIWNKVTIVDGCKLKHAIVNGGVSLDCSCGGVHLDDVELDMLGSYKKVTISKDDTVVRDGAGEKKSIKDRSEQIRSAIELSISYYDKEKLQERLAKLSGGVAVLKIGGASKTEVGEKKYKVTDALNATKATILASSKIRVLGAPGERCGGRKTEENCHDPVGGRKRIGCSGRKMWNRITLKDRKMGSDSEEEGEEGAQFSDDEEIVRKDTKSPSPWDFSSYIESLADEQS